MEKKRWRAERGEEYYYINFQLKILFDEEDFAEIDEERYDVGNYFETKEEAQEYAEYMKKCSLEWHEKRDNNE